MKQSPSQQCKQAGLKSLAELVRASGVSEQTLINWHRDKPKLFELLICGALNKKAQYLVNSIDNKN